MLSVGLMSGTSMDGIDAALLETDGTPHCVKEKGAYFLAYDRRFQDLLKAAEKATRIAEGDLKQAALLYPEALNTYLKEGLALTTTQLRHYLNELENYLPLNLAAVIQHSTDLHAQAVQCLLQQEKLSSRQIQVVGYHGQTLFHHPKTRRCIVMGNAASLVNQLQIPVIFEFRQNDLLQGGQGAPLAPLYHHALAIRDHCWPCVIVNCGGIANLTFVPSPQESDLVAFDTGPGNVLLDQWVRQKTNGKEAQDTDGRYGQKGKIHEGLFPLLSQKAILEPDYFTRAFPKSLDYGAFVLIPELNALSLEEGCATLAAFTANTIVESARQALPLPLPPQWIVAGGGWKNIFLFEQFKMRLSKYVPQVKISSTASMGWHPQALEAQLFAYLAVRSLQQQPLSLPNTTGVPYPLTGGRLYSLTPS